MIESPYSPYPGLVFRETFNGQASIQKNGGVFPNGVVPGTFEDGKYIGIAGERNMIEYDPVNDLSDGWSVRSIISFESKSSNAARALIIADRKGNSLQISNDNVNGEEINVSWYNGSTYKSHKTVGLGKSINQLYEVVITKQEGDLRLFVDGIEYTSSGVPLAAWNKFIVGHSSVTSDINIQNKHELLEIYNRALTSSEIKNLNEATWNKELNIDNKTLLDFDSTNGVLQDRAGNPLAPTDIDIKKIGTGYSAEFGKTRYSSIDAGSDVIGTKAVTIMGWANQYSIWKITDQYFNNGAVQMYTNPFVQSRLIFTSNSGQVESGTGDWKLGEYKFFAVTRKADGKGTIYIGSLDEAPKLSGAADQDSGTPVSGTTNLFIGNRSIKDKAFKGKIPKLCIVEGILSLEQITQYWSETLKEIK